MNPDTGQIYVGEAAVKEAEDRGEPLVELTAEEAEEAREMTLAERVAWISDRGRDRTRGRVPSPHARERRVEARKRERQARRHGRR